MRVNSLRILALAVAALGLTPMTMQAQQFSDRHPEYLHALSDLRAARALLSEGWTFESVRKVNDHAVQQIDAAMAEIKRAAIDDGKNLSDHPPIDARLAPRDRFRQANELLGKAHQDIVQSPDDPKVHELRLRAMYHIDDAHNTVDVAIRTAHWN
jgi:hypothetical protein